MQFVWQLTLHSIQTYIREGRAIRRLVSLSDPVTDLTREYDQRVLLADGPNDIEDMDSTDKYVIFDSEGISIWNIVW